MGKKFKNVNIIALVFSLFFVSLASTQTNAQDRLKYDFEKINGKDYGLPSKLEQYANKPFLEDFDGEKNDLVQVIVELKGQPVIEKVTFNGLDDKVLANETAKLEVEQDKLIDEIEALDSTAEVTSQSTYLTNSLAVTIKAGSFDKVRALSNVKRVFVERVYQIPTPQMASSNNDVNAPLAWNVGYKGQGMTVAVLDTGLDTDHEAFKVDPLDPKYTKDAIVEKLNGVHSSLKAEVDNVSDLYENSKVPFRYDYADDDVDVAPTAELVDLLDHGTHVAGTVAGNNGANFKGVAPEAQLFIFKVFSNEGGGAPDSVIVRALEDAVLLEVDAINMSLGSDGGFSQKGINTLMICMPALKKLVFYFQPQPVTLTQVQLIITGGQI